MTYEKKYTKYKQKYLNLISKINVLEGGAGEREYAEGLVEFKNGNIKVAVELFEQAARLGNMDALKHLFDLTEISARRGIIEEWYLRGKLLLDRLEQLPISDELQRQAAMANFVEARSLFRFIEQQCTQVEYDDPNNTILERAIVSLLRMGEQVQNFDTFEHSENLVLRATDRFVFDISNIDDNIRIVSDLCANLVRTRACNTVGSGGETRECILGEAIGSYTDEDITEDRFRRKNLKDALVLPIQNHLTFPLTTSMIVHVKIAQAILKEASQAQIEMLDSMNPIKSGRVFLFSGNENNSLQPPDIVAPHTDGRFPDSIFDNFKLAVQQFPDIEFVVVCYKHNLAQCYRRLPVEFKNVRILTLAQFIRGNIPNFSPLALTSHNLSVMAAASSRMASAPSGMAAASSGMATSSGMTASSGMAAAPSGKAAASSGKAAATRVPPFYKQQTRNKKLYNSWYNTLTGETVRQCPEGVTREVWTKMLMDNVSSENRCVAITHQFFVYYETHNGNKAPTEVYARIQNLCSTDPEEALRILFDDNELNKFLK